MGLLWRIIPGNWRWQLLLPLTHDPAAAADTDAAAAHGVDAMDVLMDIGHHSTEGNIISQALLYSISDLY